METCVLIPQEFSLVLTAATASVDGRRGAGITAPTAGLSVEDRNANRLFEMRVDVWSNTRIPQGAVVYPFQGTIRLDKLEVYSYLDDNDIRHRFGCYDEITEVDRRRVRHCNWVRFLRASPKYTEEVNLIGTKIKGDPVYEVIKPIPPNTELVVYYLPERPEEVFFMPAVHYLRNSLYRRTMDTILEDSPLDLSMSLLSRVLITPPSDSDERKSVSGDSSASSSSLGSSSASSSGASSAGDIENLKRDPNVLRPTPGSGGASPVEGTGAVSGGAGTDSAVSSASSPTASPPKKTRERTLLPCEVCGKAFDRPSLLKRHMRTHTGEKPHVCEVCGKGFSTSSSLNTHRRIHSGEKPHQCQVCGKRFTASSNLYYHRMTHIKEKPHKCQLCSKSFPTPGDLKSHMYVHNGSWPFKCHICNRGFSKHTNLKNHLFLHTGDKPHACELCHKRFALACNLRAHLKTHEGDPQEECVRCGKVYLASSQQIVHGFCSTCYQSSQGLPLVKGPSVQGGCNNKTILPASSIDDEGEKLQREPSSEPPSPPLSTAPNDKSLCDSGEEEGSCEKRSDISRQQRDEEEDDEEEGEEVVMDEDGEHLITGRTATSDEGCYSP